MATYHKDAEIELKDFKYEKVIGRGGFGKVIMVRKRTNGKVYAMKVLDKTFLSKSNQQAHTKSERQILASAKSPFIVKLFYAFQTETKLCLVTEFVNGGELTVNLRRARRFLDEQAAFYAGEIALALGALHQQGIIYRDLKSDNVLIASDGHVKLIDFGLAKQGIMQEKTKTYTMAGTPDYLAPEMLAVEGHDKTVDWWSLV